ncbi:hypothetical protein BDR04DRAFT_1123383 [Suillus decipiens]|nr:hypothetical protein BDR04DRAFT_1123383 [Suillus decipiens]
MTQQQPNFKPGYADELTELPRVPVMLEWSPPQADDRPDTFLCSNASTEMEEVEFPVILGKRKRSVETSIPQAKRVWLLRLVVYTVDVMNPLSMSFILPVHQIVLSPGSNVASASAELTVFPVLPESMDIPMLPEDRLSTGFPERTAHVQRHMPGHGDRIDQTDQCLKQYNQAINACNPVRWTLYIDAVRR